MKNSLLITAVLHTFVFLLCVVSAAIDFTRHHIILGSICVLAAALNFGIVVVRGLQIRSAAS